MAHSPWPRPPAPAHGPRPLAPAPGPWSPNPAHGPGPGPQGLRSFCSHLFTLCARHQQAWASLLREDSVPAHTTRTTHQLTVSS